GHAHRRADHLRRFGLELGPELIPVDEIRSYQRCDQRNDEGNRQSEQRRLHGVSSGGRGTNAASGAGTSRSSQAVAAPLMRTSESKELRPSASTPITNHKQRRAAALI